MDKVTGTIISDWSQLTSISQSMFPLSYRGHRESAWDLSTSLERMIQSLRTNDYLPPENREHWLLHEFKRKSTLYRNNLPAENDKIEWLALMQHYGTPTRLLDFTHSIYIAAFFAIEYATADAAIWGINTNELHRMSWDVFNIPKENYELRDRMNMKIIKHANTLIGEYRRKDIPNFVIPIEPNILSERMNAQKGLFMMPSNISTSFLDNLIAGFGISMSEIENPTFVDPSEFTGRFGERLLLKIEEFPKLLKIVIPSNMIDDGIELLSSMNLTAETLFSGIDGMARSLIQTLIRS